MTIVRSGAVGKFGGMEEKMVEACCVRKEKRESVAWREELVAGRICARAYSRELQHI